MNIHFNDKRLFNALKSATIAKVVVGSHMYGTNNEHSDTDYLYIYATSKRELFSIFQTQHQLQYKEDGVDYNFVSLHNFMKNCISGDSTINFEVLQSSALDDISMIGWLSDYKNDFITYTIIRSYLGFARRDIKFFHKAKTDNEKKKRLGHIIRGAIYADDMLNHVFDFETTNRKFRNVYKNIDITTNKMLRTYEKMISNLRVTLNNRLDSCDLGYAKYFNIENGSKLNDFITIVCMFDTFKEKQAYLDNLDRDIKFTEYFINAFENWVEYN